MRFFGDGGSEKLNYLLHNLAKQFSTESSTLKIGWGALQLTTHAPKTLFYAKKVFFCPFWGKKCGRLVMAAPKHWITCSKNLQNTFLSSTLKIGCGALQLTTQAPETLF